MDRRSLMAWALRAFGLAGAGIIGVPSLLTALAPVIDRRGREEAWQPLGPLAAFPVGEMRKAVIRVPRRDRMRSLREQAVYAWRPGAEETIVYSRSCTDLGCPVTWDPGSQCFFCPCHGGIFDKNGERMAGPPKRPLYRYASRIRNGSIEVDVLSLPPVA